MNKKIGLFCRISLFSLIVAGVFLCACKPVSDGKEAQSVRKETTIQRINRTGVIRVGYGGFPPYISINPNEKDQNKRITGFSADLVRELAERQVPPLKIEWVNFNWDTLKADMLSDKFDFVAEPVFQTIPRAMDFGLCEPYSYFGIAVAVVRKDETRFNAFSDLDRPDITVSLAQGWTSTEFAQKRLTKAKFKFVPVEKDAYVQCDDVLLGRADVALNDVPTIFQYVQAHSDKVKALWIDNPPSSVGGGFVTRKEDTELREFLNAATRILKADGVLVRLDHKWKSLGYFEPLKMTPGEGLR